MSMRAGGGRVPAVVVLEPVRKEQRRAERGREVPIGRQCRALCCHLPVIWTVGVVMWTRDRGASAYHS
jgi:hypothetical protein